MNNFLLQFLEKNTTDTAEMPMLEYDHTQQLTVFKDSGKPAISVLTTRTETGVKSPAPGDPTEFSGGDEVVMLLKTSTQTKTNTESSDADRDSQGVLNMLMRTTTDTYNHAEQSDADPQ